MGQEGQVRALPRRAVVVGAGIVGLSVAWHLQRRAVEVAVVDRDDVAAGSSWGNAGWISPGLVAPLPEPSVRRVALGAFTRPSSPVYVPPTLDPGAWRFLVAFALRCTAASWKGALPGLVALGRQALDAYDELADSGVRAETTAAPVVAAFAAPSDAATLRHELEMLARAGQPVTWCELDGDGARDLAPHLSGRVASALRIDGQRFVDPGAYVRSLADAFTSLGGQIRTGVDIQALEQHHCGVRVLCSGEETMDADVVVVAAGAWIDRLVAPAAGGVSVRAGRGYSFTVDTEVPPSCPVYLPQARLACTPYRGALRVAGGMEITAPGAAIDRRRIRAMENAARPFLSGVDWATRRDEWVGSRPVTADGLPVVGRTRDPHVFVAGGHGMWGMTLGPVTGRLLASLVADGGPVAELAPFDPGRRVRPLRQGRTRRPRPGAELP